MKFQDHEEARQLSDSDEDDTEIQRLDDEDGFIDFTKVGPSGARRSMAGGTSQGSGGKSLKSMLGKKFQNRMSLIRRDTQRRESINERRRSLAQNPGNESGAMGAIQEDESDD